MAVNSPKEKKTPSKKELNEAVRQVRLFWKVGHKSLQGHPDDYSTGPNSMKAKEAAKIRWKPGKLRVARTFARHCTGPELEKYLKEACDTGYLIGRDVVLRLVEVENKAQRRQLWKECLAEKWSKVQFVAARRRLLGTDLATVKTFYTKLSRLNTTAEARDMLRQSAARFLRVIDAVERPDDATEKKYKHLKPQLRDKELAVLAKSNKNGSMFSKMSVPQRRRIAAIRSAMEKFAKSLG